MRRINRQLRRKYYTLRYITNRHVIVTNYARSFELTIIMIKQNHYEVHLDWFNGPYSWTPWMRRREVQRLIESLAWGTIL